MAKRTIITIGREYGSGGREIGSRLAQEMGLAYYDKELLVLAAKESGIAQELFEHNDEMPVNSLLYSLSVHPYSAGSLAGMQNMPLTQKMFLALFEVIQKIARQEDCVIVGRCADYALRSYPDCLNVFIHAPLPYRTERVCKRNGLDTSEAKERILKTDKKRASYYNSYSDRKWGSLQSYHLSFDSSLLGVESSVALIRQFVRSRL